MVTVSEPVTWNRKIIQGTDHTWTLRRVDGAGLPIIPTAARAQVRPTYGGPLWLECGIAIDAVDGWITVTIPREDTESAEWNTRRNAIWDLEVDAGAGRLRWVEGAIAISPDVTRDEP